LFDDFLNWLESQNLLGVPLTQILSLIIIILIAIVLERFVTQYLKRFAKRTHMHPQVANSLYLTFRLLILIGAVAFLIRAGGLPTDWIVAFSALGGAALGFASTKTIGNFIAGLFLFAARPFRVGDYVRLGMVEGVVEEMTINYTKVYTIAKNTVSVSNLQILDRDITNYSRDGEHGGLAYYTFELAFDHSVSTVRIDEVFRTVFKEFEKDFAKPPECMLLRTDGFSRVYLVYIYIKDPSEIFRLRPLISERVYGLWDKEREKTRSV